jgi:hypothetical protein
VSSIIFDVYVSDIIGYHCQMSIHHETQATHRKSKTPDWKYHLPKPYTPSNEVKKKKKTQEKVEIITSYFQPFQPPLTQSA